MRALARSCRSRFGRSRAPCTPSPPTAHRPPPADTFIRRHPYLSALSSCHRPDTLLAPCTLHPSHGAPHPLHRLHRLLPAGLAASPPRRAHRSRRRRPWPKARDVLHRRRLPAARASIRDSPARSPQPRPHPHPHPPRPSTRHPSPVTTRRPSTHPNFRPSTIPKSARPPTTRLAHRPMPFPPPPPVATRHCLRPAPPPSLAR